MLSFCIALKPMKFGVPDQRSLIKRLSYIQHNSVQYSIVQYSIVQYSTVN